MAGKDEGDRRKECHEIVHPELTDEQIHPNPAQEKQEDAPVHQFVGELGDAFHKGITIWERDHIGRHSREHVLRPKCTILVTCVIVYDALCSTLPLRDVGCFRLHILVGNGKIYHAE